MKLIYKQIFLLTGFLLVTLLLAEIVLRLFLPLSIEDSKYGWQTWANWTENNSIEDTPGNIRNVSVTYFNHGFKRWGDVETDHIKMLIIGDSFTHAYFVNNGEEWYSYLEDAFDIELFVYGAGGYSSLQEYMILDDFIDVIDPDIIIWQFSDNDFSDNYHNWDIRYDPLFGVRPYLENNKIVYRMRFPFWGLRKQSRVINSLFKLYDRYCLNTWSEKDGILKNSVLCLDVAEQDKQNAYNVTSKIMRLVKKRAEDTPVYFFSPQYMDKNTKDLAYQNKFKLMAKIYKVIDEAKDSGKVVTISDENHWNVEGNRLVGLYLVEYFKEQGVLS